MPFALEAIALLIAETIWPLIEFCEPVHVYEQPMIAQASWMP